jgi:hypothetical protein
MPDLMPWLIGAAVLPNGTGADLRAAVRQAIEDGKEDAEMWAEKGE